MTSVLLGSGQSQSSTS